MRKQIRKSGEGTMKPIFLAKAMKKVEDRNQNEEVLKEALRELDDFEESILQALSKRNIPVKRIMEHCESFKAILANAIGTAKKHQNQRE